MENLVTSIWPEKLNILARIWSLKPKRIEIEMIMTAIPMAILPEEIAMTILENPFSLLIAILRVNNAIALFKKI